MIALLLAVLLPRQATQAAELETVTLTAEQGKAAVEVEIPDDAEGVSTLRLRVRIEGDLEYLDSTEPVKFVSDENVKSGLLETRYNADKGYFTIYLSDTKKVTDKSRFLMGYLVPNVADGKQGSLMISVMEDGLEYVDGTGQLNEAVNLQPSMAVLDMNQPTGNPEEPGSSDNGSTGDGGEGTESGTAGSISGGTVDDSTNAVEDGVGSGSGETPEKDNMQAGNNTGEVVTAVQTGDDTSIIPFCVMIALSVLAVFSILAVQRKRLSRK